MWAITWLSYSPQSSLAQYGIAACLRRLSEMGQAGLDAAGRVLLFVLFRREMVVRSLITQKAVLVWDPIDGAAVLCWQIHEHRDGELTYFTLGKGVVRKRDPTWLIRSQDCGQYRSGYSPVGPAGGFLVACHEERHWEIEL